MISLIVGKMIIKTWKNRFVKAVKKFPLLILLPVLICAALVIASNRVYVSFEQTLQLENVIHTSIFQQFFGNISTFSFYVMIISVFLMWQWLIAEDGYERVAVYLPISRTAWRNGMLIPIWILLGFVLLILTAPLIYLFLTHIHHSIWFKGTYIIMFYFLMAIGILTGLVFQQITYFLSRKFTRPSATETIRKTVQLLVFLVLGGLIGLTGYLFNLYSMNVSSYLPFGLYEKLLAGPEIPFMLFILYIAALCVYGLFVLTAYQYLTKVEEKQAAFSHRKPVFYHDRVLKRSFFNYTETAFKRMIRDQHTGFYTLFSIGLFLLLAVFIRLSGFLEFAMVAQDLFLFMVPVLLAIYPSQAYSKEMNWSETRLTLPIKHHLFISGHLSVFVGMLTVLTLFLHSLLSLLLLQPGQYITITAYCTILYTCAYLAGSLFPVSKQKAGASLQQLILIYIVAGAVFFLIQSSWVSNYGLLAIGSVLLPCVIVLLTNKSKREVLV